MSFREIISKNEAYSSPRWWPYYAYHYTDVRNAVHILESGTLYSRLRAEEYEVMLNDNASRQVINMTDLETASYVRFYFRPLTPTQYHNEGFKHRDLRYDGDRNANVPVPVFFFFHLEQLLADPKTCFSEGTEAGRGNPLFSGEEAFANLDFGMIYRNGPYFAQDEEGKKKETSLRHSEILYPGMYQIHSSLAGIVCRNEEERMTLLNLLRDRSNRLFLRWQPRIKVIRKDLYYGNGLYIDECSLHDNDFSIMFSDPFPRKRYAKKHSGSFQVNAEVQFIWIHGKEVLYRKDFVVPLDYLETKPVSFHGVPEIPKAQELAVRVYLDGNLMCYQRYSLMRGEY